MRTKIVILFIFLSTFFFGQSKFPLTGPRVDTNYYLHLEIRPQDQLFEYYYNTKKDTLEFVMWVDKKRTSVLVYVDKKFKAFLIDKLIYGFNDLKVVDKHKPIRHYFSVFCIIHHNHTQKQIDIRDKFYLDKLQTTLADFNSRLPLAARFDNHFNYSEYNSDYLGKDTTITIDIDHSEGGINKKDKLIYGSVNKKKPFELNYFDTVENKKVFKHPITFDPKTLNTLRLKSVDYVNSFSIKGAKFSKATDTLEVFGVEYSVPGIYMNSKITSLEKMRKNKKAVDMIDFINYNLDAKYRFD